MKNRDIVNIVGFMIMLIIIVLMYFFRYDSNTIDDSILNKKWYRYDYNTGYYEIISLNKNSFTYYRPINSNSMNAYDLCNKYTYDKKKNSINLDCGKSIKIISVEDDSLLLSIDNKDETFYLNVDDSLNYEFESYFGKSIVEFKKDKSQAKDFIKINEEKLKEIISLDEYSKIVFIGDNCTSVDCVLALEVMEKWISKTENVYYFDNNDFNDELMNYLIDINNNIEKSDNFFNGIYPRVIISNNNKIIDYYEVKCSGFNCSKYNGNEF